MGVPFLREACRKAMSPSAPVPGAADAPPVLSVIIPHYRDLANLDHCLTLLAQQEFAQPFEIIVVDNASPLPWTDIEAVVARRAHLIACAEKGAGPARNAGIAAARANRLAFIDSDCRPRTGWLAAGHAALDRFDFAGGQVVVEIEEPGRMTPVEAFEAVFAFRFKDYIEKKRFTGTGNLFAHKRVFDAVGGFKPGVSEDVEWSHRALAGGFSLGYEPQAVVGHPARRTYRDLKQKWERLNREGFLLARSRPYGVLRYWARSFAVLLSIAPHLLKVMRAPQLPRLLDRVKAAATLVRIRLFRFVAAQKSVLQLVLGRQAVDGG